MNDELPTLGGLRARGVALLLLVAVAGGAAGGAVDRLWLRLQQPSAERNAARATEAAATERRRLAGREPEGRAGGWVVAQAEIPLSLSSVELTPDQHARIGVIMARWRPVADSLLRSVRPRISEIDFQMRQEVMCVLTPKQRDEWVAWRRREGLSVEEGDAMLQLVRAGRCPAGSGAKR